MKAPRGAHRSRPLNGRLMYHVDSFLVWGLPWLTLATLLWAVTMGHIVQQVQTTGGTIVLAVDWLWWLP